MPTELRLVPGMLCLSVWFNSAAVAQERVIFTDSGQAIEIKSESLPPGVVITPSNLQLPGGVVQPPNGQPPSGEPKPGEKKPEDGKKPGEKKKPEPKFIVRPEKPETAANPRELLAQPGTDGKMSLSFSGQTWPDVLRWLKRVSKTSLDWDELPKGYINLVTSRRYSVPEIRDILNRHLLTRGFTILVNGEIMSVRKIATIDPSLVPRITEDELNTRLDHEFVKISFALKSMLASEAVEELAPMKSPNGKLVALSRTNRLEAMDTVINLREIRDVIRDEQSGEDDKRLVRPFPLKYVKAEDVVNLLKGLLGEAVSTGGGGGAMNPQMMQQMMQMQMMQAAQAAAAAGGKKKKPAEKVHIIANVRDNEILVNAPPDKMALIEEAVLIIDKPPGMSDSRLTSVSETEVYRLTSLDPQTFLTILEELGAVTPRTRIQIDSGKRALIVSGPRSDHIIIEMLVKKLDGSSRHFHVIPLRKHDADYVAGSIRFMLGAEVEKKQDTQRRSFFFNEFGFGGGRGRQTESKDDSFRIDADLEYNRLLLWCNEMELGQIQNLLVELGELTDPRGNMNRRRSFQVESLEEALKLIDKIEKTWPSRGRNKLDIAPLPELPKEDDRPKTPSSPDQLDPISPRAADDSKSPALPAKAESKGVPTAAIEPGIFRLLEVSRRQTDEARPQETPSTTPPGDVTPTPDESVKPPAVANSPLKPDSAKATSNETDPEAERLRQLIERLRKDRAAAAESGVASERTPVQPQNSPIHIRVTPSGEIYFESDDTRALDALEEALTEYAPPRRDWKVIQLKYPDTWALGIELILHDVFKAEIEAGEKGGGMEWDPFFGMVPSRKADTGPRRLSNRKPLKIISDRDSHTILVQGATRDQMRMIEDLIAIYDRPQSTEAHAIRKTKIFQLKYTQATVIAEAIKDVYRDLLSENDKALQQNQRGDEKERPVGRGVTYIYGGSGGEDGEASQEQRIKFKGQLSIGVDSVSNTLIVSAGGGLLDNVAQIDEAAKPNSAVQVIQIDSRVNPRLLQQKLHKLFGPKPPQQQPGQKGKKNKNGEQPNANPDVPQNAAIFVE
jgi:type II secretory pathway component GspD/PulD (secretin)